MPNIGCPVFKSTSHKNGEIIEWDIEGKKCSNNARVCQSWTNGLSKEEAETYKQG